MTRKQHYSGEHDGKDNEGCIKAPIKNEGKNMPSTWL